MYKICLLVFISTICACNSQSNNLLAQKIKVNISKDSLSVELWGVDPFILKEMVKDSLSEQNWQSYFSVYHLVNEDMQDLEKPMAGQYQKHDQFISFKPKEKFKKGANYWVEIYIRNPDTDISTQLKKGNSPFNNPVIRKEIQF